MAPGVYQCMSDLPMFCIQDKLHEWANLWQMNFNSKKCNVMHFNPDKANRPIHTYTLGTDTLDTTDSTKYLGIYITTDLKWTDQIAHASKKATKKLGMLRRQLQGTTEKTRVTLCKTIIRTQLEYASSVWSPYNSKGKAELERMQRHSTKWISSLKKRDRVTQAVDALNLDTLEERRKQKDAKILDDIHTNKIDIPRPYKIHTTDHPH